MKLKNQSLKSSCFVDINLIMTKLILTLESSLISMLILIINNYTNVKNCDIVSPYITMWVSRFFKLRWAFDVSKRKTKIFYGIFPIIRMNIVYKVNAVDFYIL